MFTTMTQEGKQSNEKKKSLYSFPIQLDRYKLIDLIGSGGMGEVFLAEDPVCHRKVALKRILSNRKEKKSARERFKKEARIAAQLSHPSIISIYDLYDNGETLYYTMPYLEGKTLKEILVTTRLRNEQGLFSKTIGGSIPSLMLAFLTICQATQHTHEKGFIHRDLKPENIVIGKYNEVTILDWGVATSIDSSQKLDEKESQIKEREMEGTAHPMGAAGTIEYMAPERAFGDPASIQSDIYSLGVILYFMLTLELPHKRPNTLKKWRLILHQKGPEQCKNPQDVAPYREITQQLSRIVLKCLHAKIDERYQSVQQIIKDLEGYLEGRPDWVPAQTLEIQNPADWKFQESVVVTKQMAISRDAGMMEWILFMLSKESYSGNIQIQATVRIRKEGNGIGFMMCVPSSSKEQEGLQKGYLIWIGSQDNPGVKLFRDNIEISGVDHIFLKPNIPYLIAVEKQDSLLRLLINEETKLTYLSHFPILGGHFGIASKDAEFELSPITLSTGSQNVLVNCLSVPDAFLLNGDYSRALIEYRRIADSFRERPEGREATFRAGFTLIQQGKKEKGQEYFAQALDEFELLHKTPGAPIEYLGKSLVYQAENNVEEEIKCLELAIRKFPKHPLRHVLDEHILFRLHETAQKDRIGAYHFTLLMLRHIPPASISNGSETERLKRNLTTNWEVLPFITPLPDASTQSEKHLFLSIVLSFWLAKPGSLYELILNIHKDCVHRFSLIENGLLSLFELGYPKLIEFLLTVQYLNESDPKFFFIKNVYQIAIQDSPLPKILDLIGDKASDGLLYSLLFKGLTLNQAPTLLSYFKKSKKFDPLHIWTLLLCRQTEEAKTLFEKKPAQKTCSLDFLLEGCLLAATEGERTALSHFNSLLETALPHSSTLLGHFLKGTIELEGAWFKQAFLWEKIQLYKQLTLYYTCLKKHRKALYYEKKILKEFSKYEVPFNFI